MHFTNRFANFHTSLNLESSAKYTETNPLNKQIAVIISKHSASSFQKIEPLLYLDFQNQNPRNLGTRNKILVWSNRAGKIRFSGARKSVLLKLSSRERCAPHNFVLPVTLQGTCVRFIVYLIVHQMK